MRNHRLKTIAFLVIIIFFFSCTKSVTYIAPQEGDLITASKKIVVVMKDGTEIELKDPWVKEEEIIGVTKDDMKKRIEFSAIQAVKIQKTGSYYAVVFTGVAIVAAILFVGINTAPSPPPSESCPFIYSFDGKNYVFDAEPYGAAICQRLKRTEWCGLEYVKEIDGQYKIMIANELDETQYTDEAKLLVVDHPTGTMIAPDGSGKIHSISSPIPPSHATDGEGKDISPLISLKDGIYWQTCVEKRNPDRKEDLRDELILEFPKPAKAKKAKLYVNASTSLWGSQVAKRFLELHGNKIDEWYDEVNNLGPAYQQIMKWFLKEELYLLHIRVNTNDGWESKGTIYGGGPFVSEDKAYLIDISDVPDETLKIKIVPPATFWKIDCLAIDYSENKDLQIHELSANQALDSQGWDVRESLAKTDNNYLIMPNKGDNAEVIFQAPPKMDGWERSIILKATGYYDIHLQAKGEPQYDVLEKFHNEPGFTIQFALREYLKTKDLALEQK